MKTLLKLTLLTAALAAALPMIRADDAAPAQNPSTGTAPAVKHPRLHALVQRRAKLRHRIAQKLNLSADQVSQLKADRAKTAAAVKAIRTNTTLAPEQRKTQVRETLRTARVEMRGVLTPDQQKQWDKMRKHVRARLGRG